MEGELLCCNATLLNFGVKDSKTYISPSSNDHLEIHVCSCPSVAKVKNKTSIPICKGSIQSHLACMKNQKIDYNNKCHKTAYHYHVVERVNRGSLNMSLAHMGSIK